MEQVMKLSGDNRAELEKVWEHSQDVPQGIVYLLQNLSRGKEERLFAYEDGQQIWW
jgi:hypothetical protein